MYTLEDYRKVYSFCSSAVHVQNGMAFIAVSLMDVMRLGLY